MPPWSLFIFLASSGVTGYILKATNAEAASIERENVAFSVGKDTIGHGRKLR